jgi:hypothetical protein
MPCCHFSCLVWFVLGVCCGWEGKGDSRCNVCKKERDKESVELFIHVLRIFLCRSGFSFSPCAPLWRGPTCGTCHCSTLQTCWGGPVNVYVFAQGWEGMFGQRLSERKMSAPRERRTKNQINPAPQLTVMHTRQTTPRAIMRPATDVAFLLFFCVCISGEVGGAERGKEVVRKTKTAGGKRAGRPKWCPFSTQNLSPPHFPKP